MRKQAETLARPIWMGEFRGVGGVGGGSTGARIYTAANKV